MGRRTVQVWVDAIGLSGKASPDGVFWIAEEGVGTSVSGGGAGGNIRRPAQRKRRIRKKPATSFVIDRGIQQGFNAAGRSNEGVSGMG